MYVAYPSTHYYNIKYYELLTSVLLLDQPSTSAKIGCCYYYYSNLPILVNIMKFSPIYKKIFFAVILVGAAIAIFILTLSRFHEGSISKILKLNVVDFSDCNKNFGTTITKATKMKNITLYISKHHYHKLC